MKPGSIEMLTMRIGERLKDLGISERAASLAATGRPDAIRYIRTRQAMPSMERLMKLSGALKASPAYLTGHRDDNDFEGAEGAIRFVNHTSETAFGKVVSLAGKDNFDTRSPLPVIKVVFCRHEKFPTIDGHEKEESLFAMTEDVIDFFFRPLSLRANRLTAVFAPDRALLPKYEFGDPLILVFDVPLNIGDCIAVTVRGRSADESSAFLIRQFQARLPDEIVLQGYGAEAGIRIPLERVGRLARVATYADIVKLPDRDTAADLPRKR